MGLNWRVDQESSKDTHGHGDTGGGGGGAAGSGGHAHHSQHPARASHVQPHGHGQGQQGDFKKTIFAMSFKNSLPAFANSDSTGEVKLIFEHGSHTADPQHKNSRHASGKANTEPTDPTAVFESLREKIKRSARTRSITSALLKDSAPRQRNYEYLVIYARFLNRIVKRVAAKGE
ncbi:hypothetical protein HK102_010090 [Quaeritorhiza haematococci]|nr:hypothetical protein HK102_010090 [Quaeritorhiza haematococci]